MLSTLQSLVSVPERKKSNLLMVRRLRFHFSLYHSDQVPRAAPYSIFHIPERFLRWTKGCSMPSVQFYYRCMLWCGCASIGGESSKLLNILQKKKPTSWFYPVLECCFLSHRCERSQYIRSCILPVTAEFGFALRDYSLVKYEDSFHVKAHAGGAYWQ